MKPLTVRRMIRHGLIAAGSIVLAAGLAWGIATGGPDHKPLDPDPVPTATVTKPFGMNPGDCPTEDSCGYAYSHGRAYVVPVTP